MAPQRFFAFAWRPFSNLASPSAFKSIDAFFSKLLAGEHKKSPGAGPAPFFLQGTGVAPLTAPTAN